MTPDEVLRRYTDEDLPEFAGVVLSNVNAIGHFGDTPLMVAATRGSREELEALLDGGANVDTRGEHGHTALHCAAGQGHVGIARILLQRGATATLVNDWGDTPLDVARLCGKAEVAHLLAAEPQPGAVEK
jgi:ankyrin repeat protein